MALNPIIQEIFLEGDQEITRALQELGEKGGEGIKKLVEAAEGGSGSMTKFASGIGLLSTAVSAAFVGLSAFVEIQDESIQKTSFLADAMGTTASAVEGVTEAFAAAGVSAQTSERFLQRLTTTISQQWPEIAQNIRTAGTRADEAAEGMVAASIRVKEAQTNQALGYEEDASKIAAANQRVSQTQLALAQVAQKAANDRVNSELSVQSASNSVASAEQRLQTLQGNPPSAAEKQSLEIKEAEVALDKAREAEIEAQQAKANQAAEQELKVSAAKQAADNAELERTKLIAENLVAQTNRANQLAEAQTHVAQEAEKAAQIQLQSIPKIEEALNGVIHNNKELATSIDLSQVSVRNLQNSIIALASDDGKIAPKSVDGFKEFATVLKAAKDSGSVYITEAQQLAVVQQLVNRSMSTGGVAASDLLHALQNGPEYFDKYTAAAKNHISTSEAGIKSAEDFRKAFELFDQQLQLVQRDLAAFISPAFQHFFEGLTSSITSSNGVLHFFRDGVIEVSREIARIGEGLDIGVGKIAAFFNIDKAAAWKGILVAIGVVITTLLSPLLAWPIIIGTVITVVGYLADNWDKVAAGVQNAWDKIKDNAVIQFLSSVVDKAKELLGWFAKIAATTPKTLPNNPGSANSSNNQPSGTNADGSSATPNNAYASGGMIHGPGTNTSDSILARLSRGEFVMRAAAVQQFGEGFMHAINHGIMPGFAMGGMVPSPVRLAGGGAVHATSTLNLTLGGRSFDGLRGPKSTIDDLTSFAISQQSSQAGNKPSWYR